jgi:DNA-binding CsgD family transcriptional regulator
MPEKNRPKRITLEYRQLRQLARSVGELKEARTTADLQALAFSALASFEPGSVVCFEKFNLEGTSYQVAYNDNESRSKQVEVFAHCYHEHPYVKYLSQGGTELAIRPTDLVPASKWKRTMMYNELYVPIGLPFAMCSRVFVPEANENLNFTVLRGKDFNDSEQALTRAYLEEIRLVFTRIHLASDSIEAIFIGHCQKKRLTPRQVEVMTQAFRGKTDKEIAQSLGNSQRTVQHQLETVYRRLGVRTRGEAVRRILDSN